jgi:hypothetical protein
MPLTVKMKTSAREQVNSAILIKPDMRAQMQNNGPPQACRHDDSNEQRRKQKKSYILARYCAQGENFAETHPPNSPHNNSNKQTTKARVWQKSGLQRKIAPKM